MSAPECKTNITAILGKLAVVILILIAWNWFEISIAGPGHRNSGYENPVNIRSN